MRILILVTIILLAIIVQTQTGPIYHGKEIITPYNLDTNNDTLFQQAYGSSAWLEEQRECTDIWQETHNESLYYACWAVLDEGLEQ